MNKIFLSQINKIKKDSIRCSKIKKKSLNENFNIDTENIFFDYSRNIIDSKTIKDLTKLAELIDVKDNFRRLCSGEEVNLSDKQLEELAVLQLEVANTRKQLREVRRNLSKDIDNLANKINIINTFLIPITLIVLMFIIPSYLGIRRRKGRS